MDVWYYNIMRWKIVKHRFHEQKEEKKMDNLYKKRFKKIGKGTIIYPNARFLTPEKVEIGDHCKIDEFTFLYAGMGIKIGNHVHIATMCSVIGAGYFEIGDHGAMATGSRILTSTNDYKKGDHMSAASPREQQDVIISKVIIEKDGFIGSNAIVHPGVTIREGSVIGSNSLVLHDTEPWTLYAGSPVKKIGYRKKIRRFENGKI